MSIKIDCSNCNTHFDVNDKFEGKKGKCPHCGMVLKIINSENIAARVSNNIPEKTHNTSITDDIFSDHIYWIKQKKIAINEKYYISDATNKNVLFSIRKAYIWRSLWSIFACIGTLLIFIAIPLLIWWEDINILIAFAVLWCFVGVLVAILITPKRHIDFYQSESDTLQAPEMSIQEDSRYPVINKTYTMLDTHKEVVCRFRKNIFTNIIRKTWHMEFEDTHIEVKEDSIFLWLLRRFMPFWKFIRTNFIFIDTLSGNQVWIFKRKFQVFDNYSLDLSEDIDYKISRKLSIGMAVLLDTGERR